MRCYILLKSLRVKGFRIKNNNVEGRIRDRDKVVWRHRRNDELPHLWPCRVAGYKTPTVPAGL